MRPGLDGRKLNLITKMCDKNWMWRRDGSLSHSVLSEMKGKAISALTVKHWHGLPRLKFTFNSVLFSSPISSKAWGKTMVTPKRSWISADVIFSENFPKPECRVQRAEGQKRRKNLCRALCNPQRKLSKPTLFTRKCPRRQFREREGNLHLAICRRFS